MLEAHEHSYERLWPMYKGVVLSKNYTNPTAPIQLVTGAAGSKHGIDEMNPKPGIYNIYYTQGIYTLILSNIKFKVFTMWGFALTFLKLCISHQPLIKEHSYFDHSFERLSIR